MTDTALPFARGGMCSNPFGGEERLDRVNLLEFLEPNAPPEKVLYCCVIQDAASNYLYAFLGKNGTSAEEFFAAWQYFFKVVSFERSTWDHNRNIKHSFTRKGQKVVEDRYLTDNELQLMCFDRHYDMSGLSNYMHIDKFRAGLKERRRRILANNWEQIETYVLSLYQHELSQIADGQQVPFQVWTQSLRELLIDPPTPAALANAIYVPNKLKRPRKPRESRAKLGRYAKLVDRLKEGSFQPLGTNWGPLASLLKGASDAEVTANDSSDSLCSDAAGLSSAAQACDGGKAVVEHQDTP